MKEREYNPKRVTDPFDFTKPMNTGQYFFSSSPELVAAGLRRLADDIEHEKLQVTEIEHSTVIKQDDFMMQKWSFFVCPKDYPEQAVADGSETG